MVHYWYMYGKHLKTYCRFAQFSFFVCCSMHFSTRSLTAFFDTNPNFLGAGSSAATVSNAEEPLLIGASCARSWRSIHKSIWRSNLTWDDVEGDVGLGGVVVIAGSADTGAAVDEDTRVHWLAIAKKKQV